jgi:hypothetical protein
MRIGTLACEDVVLNTLNIPGHVDDDSELPYLYWIPELKKKTPCKQRFIAGSTKLLSVLLAKISPAVKERLQMYCATVYAGN